MVRAVVILMLLAPAALADSSKLGRRAFARICSIDCVDILVTGATGDGPLIADLRAAGVDVMTVRLSSRS